LDALGYRRAGTVAGSKMVLCLEHAKKKWIIISSMKCFHRSGLGNSSVYGNAGTRDSPLPSEVVDAETKLPEKYKVLLDVDERWHPMIRTINRIFRIFRLIP